MQELRPRVGPERNPECPVCHPVLNSLAVSLPYAHCSQVLFHIFQVSYDPTTAKEMLLMAPSVEEQQFWVARLLKKIQKSGYKATGQVITSVLNY